MEQIHSSIPTDEFSISTSTSIFIPTDETSTLIERNYIIEIFSPQIPEEIPYQQIKTICEECSNSHIPNEEIHCNKCCFTYNKNNRHHCKCKSQFSPGNKCICGKY